MSRRTSDNELQQLVSMWRGCNNNPGTGSLPDPFAVNPIRRSFGLVVACLTVLVVPFFLGERAIMTSMLTIGWLAIAGLVFGLPVLIWSLAEASIARIRTRLHPAVDELDLSPRLKHVLQRHGYQSIDGVDSAPDAALLLLSNLDTRGLQEVRRAISIWKYRRWQEQGFPVVNR